MQPDVCSLKVEINQAIPPNTWTVVRIPYSLDGESTDVMNMHSPDRAPGGPVTDWATDDRSGLVWPSRSGWANLYGMVQWKAPTGLTAPASGPEYKDQFIRDPFEYTTVNPADTTATNHRPPSPGMQCFTTTWGIFVDPDVPLALRVAHNLSGPLELETVELKLAVTY